VREVVRSILRDMALFLHNPRICFFPLSLKFALSVGCSAEEAGEAAALIQLKPAQPDALLFYAP
jgi:hypothetical protein